MLQRLILIISLACSMSGFAKQITSLSELSNDKVVTIERRPLEADTCGYLSYVAADEDVADYTLKVVNTETVSDNQHWVIYYQPVDAQYYLYNLGSQRCVNVGSENCQLSELGTKVDLQYVQEKDSWIISGNSYMLGLSKGQRAAAYFLGDTDADATGFFYTISETDRTLTDSEQLTMQDVVNGTRRAAIEEYRTFAEMAYTLNSDGLNNYCGGYAIDELYNTLKNNDAANISLTELARMKQEAIESSYPSATAYYRIKNYVRPSQGKLNNYMTLQKSGDKLFCQNSDVVGVSNSTNNGENLRLFQFHGVDGLSYDCARIRVCAVDKGLQIGNKDAVVTFMDNDEAYAFKLVRKADNSRLFMLQYNGQNKRLTTNGVNGGQAIAINTNVEDAMSWYIEKVESFDGPILTDGVAALTLPCPVYVPDDCIAYYVAQIKDGSAKISEIGRVVPAYTPFILMGEAGSTPTFVIAGDELSAASDTENMLSGTTYRIDNTADVFLLTKNAEGEDVFVRTSSLTELSANMAYILADNVGDGISTLSVSELKSECTNVTGIVGDSHEATQYDLHGRVVKNATRGTITIDANGHKRQN